MQISNYKQPLPKRPEHKPPTSAVDLIGLGNQASSIDVFLDSDEYKNISERDAAKMLGYFTQAMQNQGFPWKLQVSSKEGLQGKLTGTKTLSDLEALRRLQKEEPVLFQPMRNLQLDLSSDSLGAIAAAGTASTGLSVASSSVVARSSAMPAAILASRSAVAGQTTTRSASRLSWIWPISASFFKSHKVV